jgi:hypothetical protein
MNRFGITASVVALVLAVVVVIGLMQPAFGRANGQDKPPTVVRGDAQDKPASGVPHYTVVETEGHNLLVTDNTSNTLYFYTVDKGEPVGSELKLRGSVDLTQVGKPTIKPKAINIQK